LKDLLTIRDAVVAAVKANPASTETHLGFEVMFAGLKGPAVTSAYVETKQERSTRHEISIMSGETTVTITFIENGKVFMTLPGEMKRGNKEYSFRCNHSTVIFDDAGMVEGPVVREIINGIKHFI